MVSQFAEYEPARTGPRADVTVVPLAERHLDACAVIASEREGGEPSSWRASLQERLHAAEQVTYVALVDGVVAGYASAGWLAPRVGRPDSVAPDGWYLAGLVVTPVYRRLGVGRRLTRERMNWIAARHDQAWYFVSSLNRASIALHGEFGFRLVARGFEFPGVAVSGEALLYLSKLGRE